MISKVIAKIKAAIARRVGPVMVAGFKSADGKLRAQSRYGSTTYFQGKEKIKMGDFVYIAQHCFVDGSNGLEIGEGCQICSYTSLLTHSSHQAIRLYGKAYGGSKMKAYNRGTLHIGAYTFVGPYATLMPNTRIGKGSLIAAYSYVKGEFPDFAIIAGNPAKVVGDTRDMDADMLASDPELKAHYTAWAGAQNRRTHVSSEQEN